MEEALELSVLYEGLPRQEWQESSFMKNINFRLMTFDLSNALKGEISREVIETLRDPERPQIS